MFDPKYAAVNDITGVVIKTFRSLRAAKRWYKKPMKLLDVKISKSAMFISMREIESIEKLPRGPEPTHQTIDEVHRFLDGLENN